MGLSGEKAEWPRATITRCEDPTVLDAITSSPDEDSTLATSVEDITLDDIDDSDEWSTSLS